MGAEAKRYLQEHSIPQLFEGLITGLIYNKPEDPIEFLESAIGKIRQNPDLEYNWDSFVEEELLQQYDEPVKPDLKVVSAGKQKKRAKSMTKAVDRTQNKRTGKNSIITDSVINDNDLLHRPSSVMEVANTTKIPDVPVILFMGGPGGGKTRHAARVQEALSKFGLVHICMPDMIRAAIAKYQNNYPEWKEAAKRYQRGELIPNNLALGLVKAKMGMHQNAKAFFLEGFPRDARQVEDFEREVKPVNMAIILDYDEATLRQHMETRGLDTEIIDARIREFKLKTLPSAKYFDDQRLLHLIPGEETDQWIFERMKRLIQRAMELGIPITTSKVVSRAGSPQQRSDAGSTATQATTVPENTLAASGPSGNASLLITKTEKSEDPLKPAVNTLRTETIPPGEEASFKSPAIASNVSAAAPSAASATTKKTTSTMEKSAKKPPKENPLRKSSKEKQSTSLTDKRALKDNEAIDSRGGTEQVDSKVAEKALATAPIIDNEVHEVSWISNATSESVAVIHPTPTTVVPIAEVETTAAPAPSQSDKPPPKLNSGKKLSKMRKTASQISRTIETSDQSTNSEKELVNNTKSWGNSSESVHRKSTDTGTVAAKGKMKSRTAHAKNISNPGDLSEAVNASQEGSNTPRLETQSSVGSSATDFRAKTDSRPTSNLKSDRTVTMDRFHNGLPNNVPIIVIAGPPGSNKAEIAARIAKKYDGFIHFSMSDLLRKEIQENTDDELWQRVGKKMDAGEAVPMKICRELLFSALYNAADTSGGYIIEGYPRTRNQATDFENEFGRLDLVILIDCTEQFCIETVKKRREKEKGARPDDDPQVLNVRLEMFKQNVLPMLKYFDDKKKLKVIDGDADLSNIFDAVVKEIDNIIFNEASNSTV